MTSPETCGACGSSTLELWLDHAADYITGTEFSVRRCVRCGLGRTEPAPTSMDPFYPARYRQYGGLTLEALKALYGRRVSAWLRHLPRRGRACEVGCGEGWMLRALRDRGWRVVGSERSVAGARAAVAANGIPMFVGDLTALGAARFDLVILFQVLEHLGDPFSTLRDGARLLAPAGILVVAVPNAASWQARVFGRFWFHLDVPRHLQHFSPDALRRALKNVGLTVVRTRVVSPEHDPYGVLQSWLNWLGFRQNLLTKLLMGMAVDVPTTTVALMAATAAVLLVPSIVISLAGWAFGSGAILEMWAAKA